MKTHIRSRAKALWLIGAIAVMFTGLPAARAEGTRGSERTESPAQGPMLPRATLSEIEERQGITHLVASPAAQIAYASSGAGLFAAGVVATKVLPVSLGSWVTVAPQPWPVGIQISGSFQ